MVGNPNSGKSSLFNYLTGLNQKIGNFPGVTVEKKTGACSLLDGSGVEIVDFPGIYSIYTRRLDEKIISEELKVNMSSMSIHTENGIFEGEIMLYVNDTRHLEQLLEKLRNVEGVVKASRFDSKE